MSLSVLTTVWERFPHGGSKLLALLALADWAGDDGGRIYPSVATLAGKIRMSERQTKRILEALIAEDWLELITPNNAGGRNRSNRYRIRLETLTSCPVVEAETRTFEAETRTSMTKNPDIAMSDEPLEPLLEPLPAEAAELKGKIDNQRRFIDQLKRAGAGEEEIRTHTGNLYELEQRLEAIIKQDDLFAGVPQNEIAGR